MGSQRLGNESDLRNVLKKLTAKWANVISVNISKQDITASSSDAVDNECFALAGVLDQIANSKAKWER